MFYKIMKAGFLDDLLNMIDHFHFITVQRLHQDLLLENAMQTVLTGSTSIASQYAEDFLLNAIHLYELDCSDDAVFQLETAYEILRRQSLLGVDIITNEERQDHNIENSCDTIEQDNNHVLDHDPISNPETDTRRMDQEHID